MTPILVSGTAINRTSLNYVGGNEPALSWSTLFSFGSVLFAAMQGTLAMESCICRISYQKWKTMLILEFLEVCVVIVSEVSSFVELRKKIGTHFEWLQWLPHVLLLIGLVELFLDVHFTLQLGVDSRLYWTPISIIGWPGRDFEAQINNSNDANEADPKHSSKRSFQESEFRSNPKARVWNWSIVELLLIMLTLVLSIILIGWRQRWWLYAAAVDEATARRAARDCTALSIAALGFCMGLGLLLAPISLTYMIRNTLFEIHSSRPNTFLALLMSFNPGKFVESKDIKAINRTNANFGKLMDIQDYMFRMLYGKDPMQNEDDKRKLLEWAPIHIGNAIVGEDVPVIYSQGGWRELYLCGKYLSYRIVRICILLTEHLTILPFQFCIVVAVFQIYDELDEQSFTVLSELVDAVIVLVAFELAVGLKTFLWSVGYVDQVHSNDRFSHEQEGVTAELGVLARMLRRALSSWSGNTIETEVTSVKSSS